jgi:capsid protein
VRGIPDGITSFIRMRDFDQFKDAELQKQITAACFAAFVETQTVDPLLDKNKTTQLLTEKIEPGLIQYLTANQKISFASPPAFDNIADFSRISLQEIATAYDLPYELLSGDMANVSYISGRLGLLPFGRVVEDWQDNVMIPQPCMRAMDWFLDAALLNGDIRTREDLSISWTAPAKTIVDEAKAIKATLEAIEGGTMPPSEAARTNGMDFDDMVQMYKDDYAKINGADLKFSSDFSKQFELKQMKQTAMKESDTTVKP